MVKTPLLFRMAVASFALLVSSCSVYHVPGQTPVPVEESPDYSVVAPDASPQEQPHSRPHDRQYDQEPYEGVPADTGAVAAYGPLLDKADAAMAKGDFEQALSLLERARRIDPDAADIYLAFARTHSARGDFSQARANAERGLLYCSGQRQCGELRNYAQ